LRLQGVIPIESSKVAAMFIKYLCSQSVLHSPVQFLLGTSFIVSFLIACIKLLKSEGKYELFF
jgi:hypothetical protein